MKREPVVGIHVGMTSVSIFYQGSVKLVDYSPIPWDKECIEDHTTGFGVTILKLRDRVDMPVRAAITVPLHFTPARAAALLEKVELAGFTNVVILNDPVAAVFAYGLHKSIPEPKIILVVHAGGETFTLSLVRVGHGFPSVIATRCEALGGRYLTDCLADFFTRRHEMPDPAIVTLKEQCEKAKIELSFNQKTTLKVAKLGLDSTVSRAKFELLNQQHIRRYLETLVSFLAENGVPRTSLSGVVLTGCSLRDPMLRNLVYHYLKGITFYSSIGLDRTTSHGAAIFGGQEEIVDGTRT